ncbi:inward rectifier potassium channel 2-like [Culex pipiens pallens]|uniref:inward rectifier potassium channel 2-like n=1 Tax=Culex pipiens pallens TaxID=42434 RepID=UPI001954E7D1|nr:inward rectifier potassium channel 2-like [Culex pipiens pallens]
MYTNKCRNLVLPKIDVESANGTTPTAGCPPEDHLQLLGTARSDKLSPVSFGPGSSTPRSPSRRLGAYRPSVFAHRVHRRAVTKNGHCNIAPIKAGSGKRLRFLQDMFTTLVDARWRWTLMVFALGFVGSWLFFALLYWFISYAHGDLEEDHLPDKQDQSNWTPCISSIYSYTSCFLFSLETQHTIGYGSRATNEECPEAIFVMSLQSVHGVMIQALLAGIIFAKMTRSKSRSQTLLFSKHAAICLRDGDLCLMFRVGDMRKSHIIGANIRAQLLRPRVTREGESMPQYQTELELTADGCGSDLFFIWPQTVVHRITADSPLWNMGAMDLTQERFEIVVILEGTIESTGQSTQARSSYLTNEILWGYRFEPVLLYNKQRQGFEINLSRFNEMVPVPDTPGCSAKELAEGLAFSSNENLLEKRAFEYGSLVEKLQQFHVEDEQCRSNQQTTISKSAYLLSPPRQLQLQAVARSHSSTELKVVNGEK